MAISPVAGAVYANQVAPAASQVQGEQQAKFDMQSALAAVAEQKKEVEEIRATDEIYKINPDQQEQKNTKQEKKKKDEKELNLDEIDEKLAELRQNEEEKPVFNFLV
ncbi:MAG: hypothetical protein SPF98_06870 [Campylobacter sp.]|nr:hypothetical protein [Campylobacter sp.]